MINNNYSIDATSRFILRNKISMTVGPNKFYAAFGLLEQKTYLNETILKLLNLSSSKLVIRYKDIIKTQLKLPKIQEKLDSLAPEYKVNILVSIFNQNLPGLFENLEKSQVSVYNLTPELLACALLFTRHPCLDTRKWAAGTLGAGFFSLLGKGRLFNDTSEKFLFTIFNCSTKEGLVKGFIESAGPTLDFNLQATLISLSLVYLYDLRVTNFSSNVTKDPSDSVSLAQSDGYLFDLMFRLGLYTYYNLPITNFSYCDVTKDGALYGLTFVSCDLENLVFATCDNFRFLNCTLRNVTFSELRNSSFEKCTLIKVDIKKNSDIRYVNCSYSNLLHHLNQYNVTKPRLLKTDQTLYNALCNTKCSLSLIDFNDINEEEIVIIVSNKPILNGSRDGIKHDSLFFTEKTNSSNHKSNKLNHHYIFYTNNAFREFLESNLTNFGFEDLSSEIPVQVPENRQKLIITPNQDIKPQDQLYYKLHNIQTPITKDHDFIRLYS